MRKHGVWKVQYVPSSSAQNEMNEPKHSGNAVKLGLSIQMSFNTIVMMFVGVCALESQLSRQ